MQVINLQFKNLKIEGFQSIGNTYLDFDNLGTCYIRGINNYDNKAKSNGSGKSSLMMSLYWVLFGKTPNGIGNDVVNKFSNTGCYVEVSFKLDNVNYVIKRSQNHHKFKTNLIILKDSEDISGRNKSDSEKVIKDILKIDEDVFSQMIFLSQGFANRFAVYTPKARKELLESLYNIDERLELFISDLKTKESILKYELNDITKSIVELRTKISMSQNIINDNKYQIDETNKEINNLINIKTNVTKDEVTVLQLKLDELNYQLEKINDKYNIQNSNLNNVISQINNLKREKNIIEEEILKFSNNKICPTCGTVLENYENNEHIQNHLRELNGNLQKINTDVNNLIEQSNEIQLIINKINQKNNDVKRNRDSIKQELICKYNEYQIEIQKDTQINSLKDKIVEYNDNISKYQNENDEYEIAINELIKNETNKNKEIEILQHCIRLANNQFKSYLLENVINLLNDKLLELSSLLFENEIIRINGDNKLDIWIGEKTYEQCSGGEQRKCDIALIIAQRFLAQQMNAISANILILDEVFDGLDDISFAIVLDLLSDEIQDVESTFIISHRDIKEIPFDKIITVTKNKNQISDVELS